MIIRFLKHPEPGTFCWNQ